ncbi:hypothetical protein T552_01984 [Pneumocystis carinii B80]|uniref:Uncharacterized protein n=1 Tax=Pneumocystis carinii (strain B80) TaxID=1408658 RepID=A0A0W4ZIC8_PNEC8|nr:hypothetical protein T552_01984 [Pneumocystis carinii B80]KTW28124.1 hypothetical protein T552_01984 [Pneumocystis carinii B80]
MRVVRVLSALIFFSGVLAEVDRESNVFPRWFGWGSSSSSSSDSTPNADSKDATSKVADSLGSTGLGNKAADSAGFGKLPDSGGVGLGNNGVADSKGSAKEGLHSGLVVVRLNDGTTKTTSGKLLTTTTIVQSYTTSISGPTTLFENGVKYVVPGPTILTITDCPCTRTLTFMTSTVTRCVCTTEVSNFDVIPTDDMPFVNFGTKLGIAGFGMTFVTFFLVFLTMVLL